MRIHHQQIDVKSGEGTLKLTPEDPEDLWHIYNLLVPGRVDDKLTAVTFRKIVLESSTGSTSTEKKRLNLTISIEEVDYDGDEHTIRVRGKNLVENEHIKIGQYHTIELSLTRPLTIWKSGWDRMHLERIRDAANPGNRADIAVILMQEGEANIYLIAGHIMVSAGKIQTNIPRKRQPEARDKAVKKFYSSLMDLVVHNLKFDVLKCILVSSPGFIKDEFMNFMFAEALKNEVKVLLENKSKFLAISSSSGHRQSLREILSDPSVMSRIDDTKAAKDVKAMKQFFDMFSTNPDRAYYGLKHVKLAAENAAVETLMVTDELFRSANPDARKGFIDLVDLVKESGGSVHIFSSLHPSGERKHFIFLYLLANLWC
jgi:protein pelota